MATLPVVGGSSDTWGNLLNAWLLASHNTDGSHATASVKDPAFGATGNGTTDDTAAVQAALDAVHALGGGTVFFPVGTYKLVTSALTTYSGISHVGAGAAVTTVHQTSTGVNGFTWAGTNANNICFRDMTIQGPGSGTGKGISLVSGPTGADPNLMGCSFRDMVVQGFGGDGIYSEIMITSTFSNVLADSNGGNGFSFAGGVSTAVSMSACWAKANAGSGYKCLNSTYFSLNGCAADGNAIGYELNNVAEIALNGCGMESGAFGFKIEGYSAGVTLTSCKTYACTDGSFWVTGTAKNVTLIGCSEDSPGVGAAYSFRFDAGVSVNVIGWSYVTAPILTAVPNQLNDSLGNLQVAGQSYLNGVINSYAGTATQYSAPVLSPVAGTNGGAAVQLTDATRDYMIYLQVNVAGTAFQVTMGNSSAGTGATVCTGGPVTSGQVISFRLPAGWFFRWSATTATLARSTAVGC